MTDVRDRLLIDRLGEWARLYPDGTAYTFVDYATDPDGVATDLTWAELDARSRAMAAALRRTTEPGERAAILAPQSLEYLVAFFGCLYARVVGVPLFSPDLPGHSGRLMAVHQDARPQTVITTSAAAASVETFFATSDLAQPKEILLADGLDLSSTWTNELLDPDDVAYLQYTSGSTRTPTGVMITHGNLTANAEQLHEAGEGTPQVSSGVSWLPLFHDMGLVFTAALPLAHANPCVLMDPVAFIMRPLRWLELLSRSPDVYSAGPNFAFEYLTANVTREEKERLDLSGVRMLLNGAEPIRPSTLDGFRDAFAGRGLRPEALSPGYGLAEATVYVLASSPRRAPTTTSFDRDALARGRARAAAGGTGGTAATALVSCGTPHGQRVAVVDERTARPLADGSIGELWVHGPNVAPGYWGRPDDSAETFRATLSEPGDLPAGPWLRTGDLGFRHDGEVYVTGRIKDLVIVDGRNHYPQDLEYTAAAAHPAVRDGYVAAFSVPDGDAEALVVVAERNRRLPIARLSVGEVVQAVRAALHRHHNVALHEFVLIEHGTLPRTTSGKLSRAATRDAHAAAALVPARARERAPEG
ncbi:fatty acyl-AMP ligase [Spirillospora sp. NPDC047279]|uniref:fatty acyl-AMP ligase n=1 Tax=Spirillospora sp. NPDC047279 TaxID=3155478 RepID=UPI0033E3847C